MTFKEIKNKITDTQIILIIKALGGDCDENLSTNDYLIFSSLLYHGLNANNHSYKMYYYRETKTFHDYKLGESFDIYDLICCDAHFVAKHLDFDCFCIFYIIQ